MDSSIIVPDMLLQSAKAYQKMGRDLASVMSSADVENAFRSARDAASTIAVLSDAVKPLEIQQRPIRELLERYQRPVAKTLLEGTHALIESQNAVAPSVEAFRAIDLHSATTRLAEELRGIHSLREHATPLKHFIVDDIESIISDGDLAKKFEEMWQTIAKTPLPEETLSEQLLTPENADVTINAEIIEVGATTSEGQIVVAVSLPWFQICRELESNPGFLFQFVDNPRRFEEFIAGAYELAGWKVTLTPRSGDGGRDVIAEKAGFGSLRFLEQCKAYRKGHRVTANDVRAMYGVMMADGTANKGLVTTTSEFAPGIAEDSLLKPILGNRLELKDGASLIQWLSDIVRNHAGNAT